MKQIIFCFGLVLGLEAGSTPAKACWVDAFVTSPEAGRATAYLIKEPRDALLVYAGVTRKDALEVSEWVVKSEKVLTTIFVTDARPEHFIGLDLIRAKFPKAKIVSTQEIVAEIRVKGPLVLAEIKKRIGNKAPSQLVVPEALSGDQIMVENLPVQVWRFPRGAAGASAQLYVPQIRAYFSGDLLGNGSYTAPEKNTADLWLRSLTLIQKVGPIQTVYPGRGTGGALTLVEGTKKFLMDFQLLEKKVGYEKAVAEIERISRPKTMRRDPEVSIQAAARP
jgi:glyoxylase-like metal-dependent hydrolase (beta-lactamase superfamily II)